MFFPIGDTQVVGGYKPIFSYLFIGLNVVAFIVQLLVPGNLVCEFAVIPQHILAGEDFITLLTSMFLHGGLMHIAGNLMFLWVFADNIEAKIGNLQFLCFYIFGGLVASFSHIFFDGGTADVTNCCLPCSMSTIPCAEALKPCMGYIPSLGASGAISAVMGAYLVMFPKSQIKVLVLILFRSIYISAWIFLGIWFVQQLFTGIGSTISVESAESEGVAWWAHIGGFVFGLACGFLFNRWLKEEELSTVFHEDELV